MITATRFPGDARAELPGAGAVLKQVFVTAGHVAPRHHHDFEQFLYVVRGGGVLECEQGSIALEPGVALHLQPGAWHSATFTADTILIETNLAA